MPDKSGALGERSLVQRLRAIIAVKDGQVTAIQGRRPRNPYSGPDRSQIDIHEASF